MQLALEHLCDIIIESICFHEDIELIRSFHSEIRNSRCELRKIVLVGIESSSLLCAEFRRIICESLCFRYLLRSLVCGRTNSSVRPKFYDLTGKTIADPGSRESSEGFFQRNIFPSYRVLPALDHVTDHSVLLIFENSEKNGFSLLWQQVVIRVKLDLRNCCHLRRLVNRCLSDYSITDNSMAIADHFRNFRVVRDNERLLKLYIELSKIQALSSRRCEYSNCRGNIWCFHLGIPFRLRYYNRKELNLGLTARRTVWRLPQSTRRAL